MVWSSSAKSRGHLNRGSQPKKANWKLRSEGREKKGQAVCDTKKKVVGDGEKLTES